MYLTNIIIIVLATIFAWHFMLSEEYEWALASMGVALANTLAAMLHQ